MTAGKPARFRRPTAAEPDSKGAGPPPAEPRAAANPHVFVTIPTANFSHRQILEGVLEHARKCGPWLFHLSTGDTAAQGLRRIDKWGCTGVIALSSGEEDVRRIARLGVPAVFIHPPAGAAAPPKRCVFVVRDQGAIGRAAADYFAARGYKTFAFVGAPRPAPWSDERRDGFRERLAKRGFGCKIYPELSEAESVDFAAEMPRLGRWLASLPKPAALYTVKDFRGQQILATCLDCGIAVPGDLAVLSTDDDEIICETSTPALSSIALDGRNTGRTCARILGELMAGRGSRRTVRMPDPRIVTRGSTDALAAADPVLARVFSALRAAGQPPPKLKDVARTLGISVRTVEAKARQHFGRPLREVLLSERVREGVAMVANTDLPLEEIAGRCGFCGASHFSRAVKAAFGRAPGSFRDGGRAGGAGTAGYSASKTGKSRPS